MWRNCHGILVEQTKVTNWGLGLGWWDFDRYKLWFSGFYNLYTLLSHTHQIFVSYQNQNPTKDKKNQLVYCYFGKLLWTFQYDDSHLFSLNTQKNTEVARCLLVFYFVAFFSTLTCEIRLLTYFYHLQSSYYNILSPKTFIPYSTTIYERGKIEKSKKMSW